MTRYTVGAYLLRTNPRQLLHEGKAVELGGRALAILAALAEHHDETLSKSRLIELAWPGSTVSDNSLHVHINTLRNRIGRNLITTVPGEGYRLTVPVRRFAARARPDVLMASVPLHLVGRDFDAAELSRLLRSQPLVTMIGPGGVGKTALARHVAAAIQAEYADGVIWVDVSDAADAKQLAAATATAADLGDVLTQGASLTAELSARNALAVFDNAEHLIAEVAALCQRLTLRHARLGVLVTSQTPMLLAGEWVMRLSGLAAPPEEAPSEKPLAFGAVELFVARAQASRSFVLTEQNAAAIGEVCRLCDGMPIAIELAAAQVGLGTNPTTLERALLAMGREGDVRRDAPERHKTIRATLDWSLQMLPDAERQVLTTLAVFEGCFTSEAATAVLQQPAEEVRLGLSNLVRRSLVIAQEDPPRYRLFNLSRRLLLERLEASGDKPKVDRRHADYYTALGAQVHALLTESPGRNLNRVIEDAENFRAALKWAIGAGHSPSHALTLCGDLYRYWDSTAQYTEARRFTADALGMPGADAPDLRASRLRALNTGAAAALYQGDHSAAGPMFQEMLALARELGNRKQEAWALHGLGACLLLAGRANDAVGTTNAALQLMVSMNEANGVVGCNTNLVMAYIELEDLEAARQAAEAALIGARAGGALLHAAFAHGALGHVLRLQGDLEPAQGHMQTALNLASQSKYMRGVAQAECELARIMLDGGDIRSGATHCFRGLALLMEADPQKTLGAALIGASVALLKAGRPADSVAVVAAVERAHERMTIHLTPYDRRAIGHVGHEAAKLVHLHTLELSRTRGRAMSVRDAALMAIDALKAALANNIPIEDSDRELALRAAE